MHKCTGNEWYFGSIFPVLTTMFNHFSTSNKLWYLGSTNQRWSRMCHILITEWRSKIRTNWICQKLITWFVVVFCSSFLSVVANLAIYSPWGQACIEWELCSCAAWIRTYGIVHCITSTNAILNKFEPRKKFSVLTKLIYVDTQAMFRKHIWPSK